MPGGIADLALSDADLPPMFRSADRGSLAGQASTLRWSAALFVLLIVCAVFGAVDIELNNKLNLAALVAAIALVASLWPAAALNSRNPQRHWYRARAAAESIKTLSWKYSVRGQPFDNPSTADEDFIRSLTNILHNLRDVTWALDAGGGEEITEKMRRLRAASLGVRRAIYTQGRLDDQYAWYTSKAKSCTKLARRWGAVTVAATGFGLTGGLLRVFEVIPFNALGVSSTVAATVAAWTQLKQYQPLATAYFLTAYELKLVKTGLSRADDEVTWSRVCADAEEAILREHTMWLARREEP